METYVQLIAQKTSYLYELINQATEHPRWFLLSIVKNSVYSVVTESLARSQKDDFE